MACTNSTGGAAATSAQAVAWRHVLNKWWPAAMPFPPGAPWVAGQVSRSAAARFIELNARELPALPTNPTDSQVAEALAVLALRASVPSEIRALGGSVGGCLDDRSCVAAGENFCEAEYGLGLEDAAQSAYDENYCDVVCTDGVNHSIFRSHWDY